MIADRVANAVGVDRNLVFGAIDRTTTLEHGDLILAVPRLCVKSIPSNDLAKSIAAAVSMTSKIRIII